MRFYCKKQGEGHFFMICYADNFAPDADGRCRTTMAALRLQMAELKPELAFKPEYAASDETFSLWQKKVRARLEERLKMPPVDPSQPPPKILKKEPRDGYTLEHWELYPDKWSAVPFMLLRPDHVQTPMPAVICIPGSHHPREVLAGEPLPDHPNCKNIRFLDRNRMAQVFAQAGYLAVAFDNPATATIAEKDSDGNENVWRCRIRTVQAMLGSGTTYPGYSVFHKKLILDWLTGLPEVDNSRIAVSGHSLGTEAALALGVLDERISAVIFNDYVGDDRRRYCATTEMETEEIQDLGSWHFVPGMWRDFAFPDLLISLAPRYLTMNEGGAEEFLDLIRSAYAARGCADRLQVAYYPDLQDKPKIKENVPMQGLSPDGFFKHCSVIPADHSFRIAPSLELLKKAFGK